MTRPHRGITIVVASLAAVGILTACAPKTYWAAPYDVAIRIKAGGDEPIAGYSALAVSKAEYDEAVASLGRALESSPRYLDLFEMTHLAPTPLADDGTITVSVIRHGTARHSRQRDTAHEWRQEKVVLGVHYADGSKNAFVFDLPPPGPAAEITAVIPATNPADHDAAAIGDGG